MYEIIASNGNCTAILLKDGRYFYSRWHSATERPREEGLEPLSHEQVAGKLLLRGYVTHEPASRIERFEDWPNRALEYEQDIQIPWSKVNAHDPSRWYIAANCSDRSAFLTRHGRLYLSCRSSPDEVPHEDGLQEIDAQQLWSAYSKSMAIIHRPATPIDYIAQWPQVVKEYNERVFAEGRYVLI